MVDTHTITHTITDWRSLIDLQRPFTLYRGQSDPSWSLASSLERACRAADGSLKFAADRERSLLLLFKRHYHDYSQNVPESDDELRWLSIMQHYGAPTRLMDWTFSVMVAAYFAVEQAVGDSVIWQLDNNLLRSSSVGYLLSCEIVDASLNVARARVSREEAKTRFSDLYLTNAHKFVRSMTPYYLDRRLVAQQGSFVCQGDVSAPFLTNLESMKCDANVLTKYLIPHSVRRDVLYHLYTANIGRFSLFPGLDGFSQSLRIYHPTVWGGL